MLAHLNSRPKQAGPYVVVSAAIAIAFPLLPPKLGHQRLPTLPTLVSQKK